METRSLAASSQIQNHYLITVNANSISVWIFPKKSWRKIQLDAERKKFFFNLSQWSDESEFGEK